MHSLIIFLLKKIVETNLNFEIDLYLKYFLFYKISVESYMNILNSKKINLFSK